MNDIYEQLKGCGHRITKPRKLVLSVLSPHPQTAHDIENEIKLKNSHVDTATVYRTLEMLVGLGIARKVNLADNSALFELLSDNNHHHHLVCSNCGHIEDVNVDESILLKEVNKNTKFKVQDHALEFFGICAGCQ